jgi:hypothetical protein
MFFGSSARLMARIMSTAPCSAGLVEQKAHLVQAHAMLAGAGALCQLPVQRASHQLVVQHLGGFALLGLVGVDQVAEVEVAVAHVARPGSRAGRCIGLGHRVEQAVGQAADRHAGVGADGAAAGRLWMAAK